ncbi:hypothetical protein CNR22_04370 [Sphingobacteriaceae bacterium]|nr:hypothetical protein CNR22_04370 [Sphingobacteriaceae bacterium]
MISNVISAELHQLIHALSKSEKRFFKIYASRFEGSASKKYLNLFDVIEKQKVYDEELILKKNKLFTKKQFPNLKVHLYNQVLKALSIVSANSSTDIKLHYQIGQAQLLYNKCLYHQSMKILEKAKKTATENDRTILLLDILELEKMIMIHTVSTRTQQRIDVITSESSQASSSVRRTDTFSNLSLKMNAFYMNIGFVRNRNDYARVRQFFFDSLPAYKENKLSFHDKLYLYYSYTGYFFFINDFQKGYFYAKRMVDLFEEHQNLIPNKIEMYIKSINNLLVAQNKLFLYSEFTETKKKLVAIKRYPAKLLNENINLNLFKAIYIHEINRHFMMGEFRSGTRIVSRLESELNRFLPKLDRHTVLILYYKIACLYFGSSNYTQSLKWLNKILNTREDGLREDLYSASRIISLICHFEAGNIELLDYSIRSTYRFLLKKGHLNKYQQFIMKFLKELSEVTPRSLNKKFAALLEELKPLELHPYERRQFLYFDIISWLESKLKNKAVELIIKEKFRKQLAAKENSITVS